MDLNGKKILITTETHETLRFSHRQTSGDYRACPTCGHNEEAIAARDATILERGKKMRGLKKVMRNVRVGLGWLGFGVFVVILVGAVASPAYLNWTTSGANGSRWTGSSLPGAQSLYAPFFVTRTWDGGGLTNNWSDAGNWVGDAAPAPGDPVTFDATGTKDVTIDINVAAGNLNISAGYTGTITMSPGINASFGQSCSQAGGTFKAGDGTLNLGSNGFGFSLSGGTLAAGSGQINFGSTISQTGGTFSGSTGNVTGALNLTGGNFIAPAGTLTIFGEGGNISPTTFDHNNGTVTFIGGNQNLSLGSITFNNLTLSKNEFGVLNLLDANRTIRVVGTLALVEGRFSGPSTSPIRAEGPIDIAPTFGFSDGSVGGGGTILIKDGNGSRTIDWPSTASLPHIRLDEAGTTLTLSGPGTARSGAIHVLNGAFESESTNLELGYGASTSQGYMQSGGTFHMGSGNLTLVTGAFQLNGGTFTTDSGNASFPCFLQFNITGGTFEASSGTTTICPGGDYNGNYTQSGGVFDGRNGTVDINHRFTLSGGTFHASSGNTHFGFVFDHQAPAVFDHNNGTVFFDSIHPAYSISGPGNPGGDTFYNLVVSPNGQISLSNDSFVVDGDLQILNGSVTDGAFAVKGDVSIGSGADGGTARMVFNGTGEQIFTNAGGANTTGTWTVNKVSGTLTAASSMILGTSQPLFLSAGTLYLENGSNLTAGALTIGGGGTLVNHSTTTITLGADAQNNGTVELNGGGAPCPQPDTIVLRSAGNAVHWSGAGTFELTDVDVSNMHGIPLITVFSGTDRGNNGPNWIFDAGCGLPDPTPTPTPSPTPTPTPVDDVPPDTTITSGPSGFVNIPAATFTFTSNEDPVTFLCSIDGAQPVGCVSGVQYTIFAQGQHTFSVQAVDAAGNTDPTPATRSWTIDTIRPDTEITGGPTGWVQTSIAIFRLESTESNVTFECALDPAPFTPCPSTVDYTSTTQGERTLYVRAVDQAGNVDLSPAVRQWGYDSVYPTVTITGGPTGIVDSRDPEFTFTADEPFVTFQCQLNQGTLFDCSSPATYSGLEPGEYTFSVRARDRANNQGLEARRSWIIAHPYLPETLITSGPPSSTDSLTATFVFESNKTFAGFGCELDTGGFQPCSSPKTYTGVAPGRHTFRVRAINGFDVDPTPATWTWTIEGTPPPTPSPTPSPTPTPTASPTPTPPPFLAPIKISARVLPDSGQRFDFTASEPFGNFTLDGSTTTAYPSEIEREVGPGFYTFTQEPLPIGYALLTLTCAETLNVETLNLVDRQLTIRADHDDETECRFRFIGIQTPQMAATALLGFGYTASEAAAIMRQLGFTPPQIAVAIKAVFGLDLDELVAALLGGQFSLTEIATVLRQNFGQSAGQAATLFKNSAITPAQMAAALIAAYGVDAPQLATAFAQAGFSAAQMAPVLISSFSLGATGLAQALATAGFGAATIAPVLVATLAAGGQTIATALRAAGFSALDAAAAIQATVGGNADQIIEWLRVAGYTAEQAARVMKDFFHQTIDQIALKLRASFDQSFAQVTQILKNLTYTATEIARTLKNKLGRSAAQIVTLLKDVQFTGREITDAMKVALLLPADQIVPLLASAGYSASTAASAIAGSFGIGAAAIAPMLAASYTSAQVAAALSGALAVGSVEAAAIMVAIGYNSTTVAQRLMEYWGVRVPDLATYLRPHFTASDVAVAIDAVSNLSPDAIADLLREAGYNSTQLTLAMKNVLRMTATEAAAKLLEWSFSLPIIGDRLRNEYGRTYTQIASIMAELGVAAAPLMSMLDNTFTLTPLQIATAVKATAKYTSSQITAAIKDRLNQTAAETAAILQKLDYEFSTIAARLKDVFNSSPAQAAQILKNLDATSTDIARAMKDTFDLSSPQMCGILADLDYSPTTIMSRLKDVYSKTATQAAEILKDEGFSSTRIARALKDSLYNKTASQTAAIMKDIGYSLNTLVRILDEVFNKGVSSITNILEDLNFSPIDIANAIFEVLGV